MRKHRSTWLLLLAVIALLAALSLACSDGGDGTDLDRSDWGWDGENGHQPEGWDELMRDPPPAAQGGTP